MSNSAQALVDNLEVNNAQSPWQGKGNRHLLVEKNHEDDLAILEAERSLATSKHNDKVSTKWNVGWDSKVRRSERTTLHSMANVLDLALSFFGLDGVGLSVSDITSDCLVLQGCGGYVCVSVSDMDDKCSVNVEARKWNALVDFFLRSL